MTRLKTIIKSVAGGVLAASVVAGCGPPVYKSSKTTMQTPARSICKNTPGLQPHAPHATTLEALIPNALGHDLSLYKLKRIYAMKTVGDNALIWLSVKPGASGQENMPMNHVVLYAYCAQSVWAMNSMALFKSNSSAPLVVHESYGTFVEPPKKSYVVVAGVAHSSKIVRVTVSSTKRSFSSSVSQASPGYVDVFAGRHPTKVTVKGIDANGHVVVQYPKP